MISSILVTQYGRFVKAVFFPKTSKEKVDHLIRGLLERYPVTAGFLVEWDQVDSPEFWQYNIDTEKLGESNVSY